MSEALVIECLKVALQIVSPSVGDRQKEVAQTAKMLYCNMQAIIGAPRDTPKPPVKMTVQSKPQELI